MARALGLLLGFPHGVRHLDGDDLQAFVHWLQELIAWAETGPPRGLSPLHQPAAPHRQGPLAINRGLERMAAGWRGLWRG